MMARSLVSSGCPVKLLVDFEPHALHETDKMLVLPHRNRLRVPATSGKRPRGRALLTVCFQQPDDARVRWVGKGRWDRTRPQTTKSRRVMALHSPIADLA